MQGEQRQLDYLRDRYNYLLTQTWDMLENLPGYVYAQKDIRSMSITIMDLKTEIIELDEKRTAIALNLEL